MARDWFGGPWAVGALVASVAINLFFIGFLTTRHQTADGPPRHGSVPGGIDRLLTDLSPEARKTVRDSMGALKRELKPDFLALKEARDDVARAIKADPLDSQALADGVKRLQTARLAIENKIEARFIGVVSTLPMAERRHIRVPDGPPPDGPPPDGRAGGDGPDDELPQPPPPQ